MSHRVIEEWHGRQVETLEDLLLPDLRAVCGLMVPYGPQAFKLGLAPTPEVPKPTPKTDDGEDPPRSRR